jgi:acyl-CoA synthetase (AMP-forming)/AMP-acid ligase II
MIFPRQVVRFVEQERISIWYSVPSALSMVAMRGGLTSASLPDLRIVLFAGEVFPVKYLRQLIELLPAARFANLYGPTETNVCAWYEVTDRPEHLAEPVPIGIPVRNDQVFAVTAAGSLALPGEEGELWVRGATVMRGYWGKPEETAGVLASHPFGSLDDPVYRTGDLVRVLDGGGFRYLGRQDDQIKSRGYRIELGDVEAALGDHPAVVEAAVVAVPDELVTNRLVAFAVVRDDTTPEVLGAHCTARLPHYMIPESITLMASLPRTSTGKVDRLRLRNASV